MTFGTFVHNLPEDILRDILKIAVLEIDSSPVLLLLVCKRWRAIALDCSFLWQNIVVSPHRPTLKQSDIVCLNTAQLLVALRRTREGHFNLSMWGRRWPENMRTTIGTLNEKCPGWYTRCRNLKIADNWAGHLTQLPLTSLQRVCIQSALPLDILEDFLTNLETHSCELRKLVDPNHYAFAVLSMHTKLLGRLKALQISVTDSMSNLIFDALPRIEELTCTTHSLSAWPHKPGQLSSLHTLNLNLYGRVLLPCLGFLEQLKSICIVGGPIMPPTGRLNAPRLEKLTLQRNWSLGKWFIAPTLESLTLLHGGQYAEREFASRAYGPPRKQFSE